MRHLSCAKTSPAQSTIAANTRSVTSSHAEMQTVAPGKYLFPFFGEDIQALGMEILRKHYQRGFTLMPVNISGIAAVHHIGLPYILLEQWLGSENVLHSRQEADEWECEWFVPAKEYFSSQGICWPVFDKEAMNWFWRDLTLSVTFARACKEREIEKIGLIINSSLRPALYYYRSDIHWHLVRMLLGDTVRVYYTEHDSFENTVTLAVSFEEGDSDRPYFIDMIAGKILMVINPGEFHRFLPVIRELKAQFSDLFTVLFISPPPPEISDLAIQSSVSAVVPKILHSVESSLGERFINGYFHSVDSGRNLAWEEPMRQIPFHFEYYCMYRWPVLASNYQTWKQLWSKYPPRVVITSTLADSESQLPGKAAVDKGIETISLPHGGFGARESFFHATTSLYNCVPSRKVYEFSGIPSEQLIPCRDLLDRNEYPTIPAEFDSKSKLPCVLVLTNPVKFGDFLFSTTLIENQLKALETLSAPPVDISKNISVMIKPHPATPDMELFAVIGNEFSKKVLPPSADLVKILMHTDLVIALNYGGTALIHALRSEKPIFFFWTDPLLTTNPHNYRHAQMFLPSGILINSPEDLWKTVRAFFADPTFAREVRLKAQRFAHENLNDNSYPSISDILAKSFSKKGEESTNEFNSIS
jgi:hypothetical protein